MSEGGFHVHGAHEHEVEHQAQQGPGLAQSVAIFTALLSTAGAIISYQGGLTQTETLLYKNEALLKKGEGSDQWSFYQAKSGKQHLMELAKEMAPPERKAFYEGEIKRYNVEKAEIKAKAQQFDKLAVQANEQSHNLERPHHIFSQAMTLVQISVSLASVTILTRKRWLLGAAGLAAAMGLVMWGYGVLFM